MENDRPPVSPAASQELSEESNHVEMVDIDNALEHQGGAHAHGSKERPSNEKLLVSLPSILIVP